MSTPDPISEESVFLAALRCPPADLAAFLDKTCREQPDLRRRIEALLEAQRELGEFMEVPAAIDDPKSSGVATSALSPDEITGTRIGRYKLLQKIGEGGCGVVYVAEQEEPLRRLVALKVIKLGMDTKSVIARFEAERQALAMMDHPNIAKVLDAGATDKGRPYFVMELVRGVKITEFCDQNRLSTRARLDLCIQVCQAVQHAHQKGIIHRDLKPSNILVTVHTPGAPGAPVIIDFGIAKATQGKLTDHTLFTWLDQFLGTPAYMSPEQATLTALDIDTRSDIYSLGVLLYELLTGRTPFDVKELLAAGFEEMRRTIREKQPLRPSTRLSTLQMAEQTNTANLRQSEPPKLQHLIRGDLDWIVMKCLEKDRARRYETANALAMDLQRYLGNEPVLARPPSRWYEMQKMVHRNRVTFAAAGIVMIALVAALLFSSRDAKRARSAELQTRQTTYLADMDLANRALEEDDLGTARRLLRRYYPEAGERDLRNWEWRYLAKRSDGDPHFSLAGHLGGVLNLCFLDDNTLMTSGASDWRTLLWNLSQRQASLIITNRGFGGGLSSISALARSRKLLFYRAGWSGATRVCMVDFEKGIDRVEIQSPTVLPDAGKPIQSLDITPGEEILAVAYGNQVRLWDLNATVWRKTFETETGQAIQGLFSNDGNLLAVADDSGQIALWDQAQNRKLGVLKRSKNPLSPGPLRFSRDGRWLVSPGGNSPTQIWRVSDQTIVAELRDDTFADQAVFSPDGRWLAIVGGTASVRLWETTHWKKVRSLRGHTDPILSVNFSPNGRLLATGARNGEIKLWTIDPPGPDPDQVSFPSASFFSFAGDGSAFGRILMSQTPSNNAAWTAEAWTTEPLQRVCSVALPKGPPRSGIPLNGGRGLILGHADGSIRIYGPGVENTVAVSNAHISDVYLMVASKDGSTLATKGMVTTPQPENQIKLWRLPRLEQIAALPHSTHVHGIQLSDNGRWLATFTGPGDLGVWEVPSMKGPPMWSAVAPRQRVQVSAFSPDNRFFAAAPPDGTAFIWDLSTHKRKALPRALTAYTSLSFSPDGSRLAAGSEGESKLFDVATGQVVLSFKQRGSQLAFAPDGERLFELHPEGASVLYAPPLEKLRFEWFKEKPSETPIPYLGPNTDYERPDRPSPVRTQ